MSNSNHGKSVTINFQPTPKRFMVWDKKIGCFLEHPKSMNEEGRYYETVDEFDSEGLTNVFNLANLIMMGVVQYDRTQPDKIICQSTNLFDKDGKEIFEGTLLKWEGEVGYVEIANGIIGLRYGPHELSATTWVELSEICDKAESVGHILLNPELLEEE